MPAVSSAPAEAAQEQRPDQDLSGCSLERLPLLAASSSDDQFNSRCAGLPLHHPTQAPHLALLQSLPARGSSADVQFGQQQGLQSGPQQALQSGQQQGLQSGPQQGLQSGQQQGLQAGVPLASAAVHDAHGVELDKGMHLAEQQDSELHSLRPEGPFEAVGACSGAILAPVSDNRHNSSPERHRQEQRRCSLSPGATPSGAHRQYDDANAQGRQTHGVAAQHAQRSRSQHAQQGPKVSQPSSSSLKRVPETPDSAEHRSQPNASPGALYDCEGAQGAFRCNGCLHMILCFSYTVTAGVIILSAHHLFS